MRVEQGRRRRFPVAMTNRSCRVIVRYSHRSRCRCALRSCPMREACTMFTGTFRSGAMIEIQKVVTLCFGVARSALTTRRPALPTETSTNRTTGSSTMVSVLRGRYSPSSFLPDHSPKAGKIRKTEIASMTMRHRGWGLQPQLPQSSTEALSTSEQTGAGSPGHLEAGPI